VSTDGPASGSTDAALADTGADLLALDARCAFDSDCASGVCFDPGGTIGPRCVSSCGSSSDCAQGFSCIVSAGAKACVAASRISGATLTTPIGGACMTNGECRSDYCASQTCIETCNQASDCTSEPCTYTYVSDAISLANCGPPSGSAGPGAPCTAAADCESNLCSGGYCARLCGTSAICGSGWACNASDQSRCTMPTEVGFCSTWNINFARLCVQTQVGSGVAGSPCSQSSQCRSAMCWSQSGQCTDLCSTDADCPTGLGCKIRLLTHLQGGQQVFMNLCMPL
jgi:hypothetical protein